jgi:hypothetical protein
MEVVSAWRWAAVGSMYRWIEKEKGGGQKERGKEKIHTTLAIFFFNAASALASALASFLALSFSSFTCASSDRVPSLAWRAPARREGVLAECAWYGDRWKGKDDGWIRQDGVCSEQTGELKIVMEGFRA